MEQKENKKHNNKYYYIYKTTNIINQKYYIGMHSTSNINDGYIGSGIVLWRSIRKYGKENFKTEILEYLLDRKTMFNREKEIVNEELLKDPLCMNIVIGGSGGWTLGKVIVKDKDNNILMISKNDPRYLSGELISNLKNKVSVKDKDGNKLQVSKDDLRYLSGELIHNMKGYKFSQEHKDMLKIKREGTQIGNKNHNFGYRWVYNIEKDKSIRIKVDQLDEYLSNGWFLGKSKSNRAINKTIHNLNKKKNVN